MAEVEQIRIEQISLEAASAELRSTLPFAATDFNQLVGLGPVERVAAPAGVVVAQSSDSTRTYSVVIKGEIRADFLEPDGTRTAVGSARTGEGFGETPILMGKPLAPYIVQTVEDSVAIRFSEEDFWRLMQCCPATRAVILSNMTQRLQNYQVQALHREKLVSLGTLAAGLMHELHNPGSAAKRAASQLRLNLLRLQQLSLRFSDEPKTRVQLDCMRSLLEHTMNGCQMPAMSSLEQSDAEEAMSSWLAAAGVENAYSIGPALVGIGLQQDELQWAKDAFAPANFSDALNWLEALVSSVTLVCTIEESIGRVSDLVMAVKKFAYDEKTPARSFDVHDSLQSTLTILGHKLRIKGIHVVKDFTANPSLIYTRGSSLSQVWTNLIDNALDASPSNAKIRIATWIEAGGNESATAHGNGADGTAASVPPDWLTVSIEDHGSGIAADALPRIFEPFFTTKPQGSGTGLGLEIVHRIVTQKFGGTIEVKSEPGNTRFIVRLPLRSAPDCADCTVPLRR